MSGEKVAPALPVPNFSDLGKAANDVCSAAHSY